jgi:predicted nucleic acid-binding Zn ribbon protein
VFRHNKFLLPSPPVLRGRRAGDEGINDLETQCPYSLLKPLTPDTSPRITGARGARLYGLIQMTSADVLSFAFNRARTPTRFKLIHRVRDPPVTEHEHEKKGITNKNICQAVAFFKKGCYYRDPLSQRNLNGDIHSLIRIRGT